MNLPVLKKLNEAWENYGAEKPKIDKIDWLQKNIYLDRNVSPLKEGYLDLSHSRHVEEMIKDYLDRDVEFMVGMMASQTGKSLYLLLTIVLQVKFDPAPAMSVYPNSTLATRVLEKRIDPLIKCNPELLDELRQCRDPITKSKILFKQMDLYLVGAGSPTQISSDTIKYLNLDETAKMRSTNTAEKDVIGNAIVRTKLLANRGRKVNIMSTPNIKGDVITKEFETCDFVRNWQIQDPETGEWFAPEWENIRWEGETKKEWEDSVHILCPSGYKIFDNEKAKFLREGRATPRPNKIKRIAWRVPSWCSQFVTLKELVGQWFDAQGDIEKIQNFKNNEQALPFEVSGDNDSEEPIKARQAEYLQGEFPLNEPCAMFVTVDVQSDRFPYVARLHTAKESWLYKYGEAMSPDEILTLFYDIPGNVQMTIAGFDTKYRKKEMIDFIKDHRQRCIPLQGSTSGITSTAPFKTYPSERLPDGKPDPRSISVYHLNRNACADMLLETINNPEISWNIPNDLPDQYFNEMTAETRILIKSRSGYQKHEWRQTKKDNHALDVEVYQIALRSIFRVQLAQISDNRPLTPPKRPKEQREERRTTRRGGSFW